MAVKPPFSRRILGSQWIQDDFPDSARMALLHLLHDLIDRRYVAGWIEIDREIRRILIEECKLALNDGPSFGPGGEGYQRINVGCSKLILEEAMKRMKLAFSKYI